MDLKGSYLVGPLVHSARTPLAVLPPLDEPSVLRRRQEAQVAETRPRGYPSPTSHPIAQLSEPQAPVSRPLQDSGLSLVKFSKARPGERQAISCDMCRQRKSKCDGNSRQPCNPCIKKGTEDRCFYATFVRRRGPAKKKDGSHEGSNSPPAVIEEDFAPFHAEPPTTTGTKGPGKGRKKAATKRAADSEDDTPLKRPRP